MQLIFLSCKKTRLTVESYEIFGDELFFSTGFVGSKVNNGPCNNRGYAMYMCEIREVREGWYTETYMS